MRFRRISPWFAGAVVMIAGGLWLHEARTRTVLQARADALARAEQELARLQAGRDQLRDELRAAEAQNRDVPSVPVVHAPETPAANSSWKQGEWTAAAAWSNEGRATPRAAVATLLWAAAGGDLAVLRDMLAFDEATRAKARAWFDSLPPAGRAQYGTPEELMAGVTVGRISPTGAQLSWLHESDPDRAIVGILLANPVSSESGAATLDYQIAGGGAPPGLIQSRSPYRVVVLNLERATDGWRIKVPTAAIDGMARWLSRPGGD